MRGGLNTLWWYKRWWDDDDDEEEGDGGIWWWWWWWGRPYTCIKPMAQGDQGRLNPGLPEGVGEGRGSNWKVSGFPTVLVPAHSLLEQEQLQLAQASFRKKKLIPPASLSKSNYDISWSSFQSCSAPTSFPESCTVPQIIWTRETIPIPSTSQFFESGHRTRHRIHTILEMCIQHPCVACAVCIDLVRQEPLIPRNCSLLWAALTHTTDMMFPDIRWTSMLVRPESKSLQLGAFASLLAQWFIWLTYEGQLGMA